ncbi:hypothetical protein AYI70_g12118 [Smittium culicis]|uniref:Uncharacterized protein n=1 Tax=Smittium culicis TaxID=133412 RepID=A0A1R1WYS9_9FUNG|nr:hypothetical protein AYI70_g12118 [Smittium culicis]
MTRFCLMSRILSLLPLILTLNAHDAPKLPISNHIPYSSTLPLSCQSSILASEHPSFPTPISALHLQNNSVPILLSPCENLLAPSPFYTTSPSHSPFAT